MKKHPYYGLARNLMIVFMSNRLGVRMATEEKKRESYEPDEFWCALAQSLDDRHAHLISEAFKRAWKADPLCPEYEGGSKKVQ